MEIQPEFKPQAATLIVAASDSLHPERADYYCDGTADDVEIQAAIDALPVGGGSVLLLDGTYTLGSKLSINTDNISLIGCGINTKIEISVGYVDNNVVCIFGSDIEIANIFFNIIIGTGINGIDGDDSVITENICIHGCKFKGNIISGNPYPNTANDSTLLKVIETGRSKGWRIYDNWFEDYGYEAVTIALNQAAGYEGEAVITENNYMKGGYGGVAIEGHSHDCIVANNYIECRLASDLSYGVLINQYSYNNTVTANTIHAEKGGVWIAPGNNNTISVNTIYSVIGLHLSNSEYCIDNIFIGNNVIAPSFTSIRECIGIYLLTGNNNKFIGNTFTGFRAFAFSIYRATYLYNNDFVNCHYGITHNGSENSIIRDNLFDGTNGWVHQYHLRLNHTGDDVIIIEGNTFRDNSADDTTTLDGTFLSGVNIIKVNDASVFRVGENIETVPTGFPIQTNEIWGINYQTNELTLEDTLTNNHTNGDPVNGRTVTNRAIFETSSGRSFIKNNRITADYSTPMTLISEYCNKYAYEGCSDFLMDVLAVSATHVRSNEDLSAATPITFTLTAQPDVPRTLSWSFDSHAQITEYDMEVIGVDAKGVSVTETWDETAGWSGETSNAFATITSIKMTSRTGTGAADTMDIGITDVLGLSNVIYSTSDVFKIKKNNANATVATAQVNTTYDTYDMSVITLGAGDDFTIWYKSNLNIIS